MLLARGYEGYPVTKLDLLVSRLNFGDTIIYISVDRFLSVSQYVVFSEKVLNAGVSLRIMEQPYLDIGNGKHWRSSVVSHLHTLVHAENFMINRLYSALERKRVSILLADVLRR